MSYLCVSYCIVYDRILLSTVVVCMRACAATICVCLWMCMCVHVYIVPHPITSYYILLHPIASYILYPISYILCAVCSMRDEMCGVW